MSTRKSMLRETNPLHKGKFSSPDVMSRMKQLHGQKADNPVLHIDQKYNKGLFSASMKGKAGNFQGRLEIFPKLDH